MNKYNITLTEDNYIYLMNYFNNPTNPAQEELKKNLLNARKFNPDTEWIKWEGLNILPF
jgi:hypothetical protein